MIVYEMEDWTDRRITYRYNVRAARMTAGAPS